MDEREGLALCPVCRFDIGVSGGAFVTHQVVHAGLGGDVVVDCAGSGIAAGRVREEAERLLGRAMRLSAEQDALLPHCIIESDPQTGHAQVHGPYPDAQAALTATTPLSAQNEAAGLDGLIHRIAVIHDPKES